MARHLFAQEAPLQQKVTLRLNGNSLTEAFALIQQATGLSFTYGADYIPDVRLDKDFEKVRLARVLDELLEGHKLGYKLDGTHLVVYPLKEEPPTLRLTLSGFIRDALSGEELIGCYILEEGKQAGTASNAYGFYSLALPPGSHTIQLRYLGYEALDTIVELAGNQQLDMALKPGVAQLQPIIISTDASGETGAGKDMPQTAKEIELDLINEMPGLLGEQDVLQSLQLLPGVYSSGDAIGAISVRGGASGQNLFLLDEAPIYYESHLAGLFSIFNPDVVKHLHLYKNHIPARYQGRLASVIDVRTAEGNDERFKASGGVGLIASRLKAEGPLLKDKASFLLAARRSHLELYSALLYSKKTGAGIRDLFSFTDLNAKANFRLGAKSRAYLSGYLGQDINETNFDLENAFPLDTKARTQWGNKAFTLRWNYLFNDKLFQNTSLIYHGFQYQFRESIADTAFAFAAFLRPPSRTAIEGFLLKTDFQYYQAPGSLFKFGAGAWFARFSHYRAESPEMAGPDDTIRRPARKIGLYVSHEWNPRKGLAVDYGVHLTQFAVLGNGQYVYDYDEQGAKADSAYYATGQTIRLYHGIEPRVSLSLALAKWQWLTLAYDRTYQYDQRITRATPNDPANIWLPASKLIKPQYANHWSVEYRVGMAEGAYEASLGLYYKSMQNQPGFKSGARADVAPATLESLLIFGAVRAKGIECLLRKNAGHFRPWLSYTFSAAEARFDDAVGGRPFPTDALRPHAVSLAAVWDVNDKIVLVGRWVYLSGKKITIPAGAYSIEGFVLDYYPPRNSFHLDENHHLDLSITVYRKGIRDRGSSLNISLINLYARRNPSYAYLKQESDGTVKAYQVSMMPFVIPSLSYNFRF